MSQQRHEWTDENGSAMSLEVRYGLAVVRRDGGLVEARPELMKEVFRLASEVETLKAERTALLARRNSDALGGQAALDEANNEVMRLREERDEAMDLLTDAVVRGRAMNHERRFIDLRARIAAREQPAGPVPAPLADAEGR